MKKEDNASSLTWLAFAVVSVWEANALIDQSSTETSFSNGSPASGGRLISVLASITIGTDPVAGKTGAKQGQLLP